MMTIQTEIHYILCIIKIIKLIGIDLSRKTDTSIPQRINFLGKLAEGDGVTMFFIAEE